MTSSLAAALCVGAFILAGPAGAASKSDPKPTIVLVHGAFAGSSSWNGVITDLVADGYKVIAAANPLRSVKSDSAYLASLLGSVEGSVVLVGHSYGGEVITTAAADSKKVKALVFVAGVAPDAGESAASLGERFPGGTLGETLAAPVPQPDGGVDLYIEPSRYWAQFAADVPEADATQMAATQRPITKAALSEPSGAPAWRTIPSWFIYGSLDKNIPRTLHAFMAERAKSRGTVEVQGASHVVMISHPADVAALIERAASAP